MWWGRLRVARGDPGHPRPARPSGGSGRGKPRWPPACSSATSGCNKGAGRTAKARRTRRGLHGLSGVRLRHQAQAARLRLQRAPGAPRLGLPGEDRALRATSGRGSARTWQGPVHRVAHRCSESPGAGLAGRAGGRGRAAGHCRCTGDRRAADGRRGRRQEEAEPPARAHPPRPRARRQPCRGGAAATAASFESLHRRGVGEAGLASSPCRSRAGCAGSFCPSGAAAGRWATLGGAPTPGVMVTRAGRAVSRTPWQSSQGDLWSLGISPFYGPHT